MWGESVDDSNIVQRIFPRASATAEKLWSPVNVTNVDNAMKRLEEHYCRMRHRYDFFFSKIKQEGLANGFVIFDSSATYIIVELYSIR